MQTTVFSNEWVRPATREDEPKLRALLGAMEPPYAAREFVVCEVDGKIVGCARVRPLSEGGTLLSDVVVAQEYRGRGLGRNLLQMSLLGARHPVFLLTDRTEIASRLGFETIRIEELPADIRPREPTVTPMRLRRVDVRPLPPEPPAAPDFLDV